MEEDFRKNQLKPGDAGFEYDKQVQGALPSSAAAAAPLPRVCAAANMLIEVQWCCGAVSRDVCFRLNSSPRLKATIGMRAKKTFEEGCCASISLILAPCASCSNSGRQRVVAVAAALPHMFSQTRTSMLLSVLTAREAAYDGRNVY
jgi:hypothetical protein